MYKRHVLQSEALRLARLLTDPGASEDRIRPEYPAARPNYSAAKAQKMLNFSPERSVWMGLAQCIQAIVVQMRDAGDLPSNQQELPPLLDAIESRSGVLAGQTCVVADATSEIGRALCVLLSRCGADVIAIGSDTASGQDLMQELDVRPSCKSGTFYHATMLNMSNLRTVANAILKSNVRIDALFHCASAYFEAPNLTEEGIDETFALNHLSAFQIIEALRPAISKQGHIVMCSSRLHSGSGLDFSDLFCRQNYDPVDAFARAKFANLMFSQALFERCEQDGPNIVAINHGLDPFPRSTARGAHAGFSQERNVPQTISALNAASRIANVLVDPSFAGRNGIYIDEDRESLTDPNVRHSASCERLWAVSEALVEIT